MIHSVFVYGTLKSDQSHHYFLKKYSGKKGIAEGIELHNGPSYPYAMRGSGYTCGEVYDIDEHTLQELDTFEEHPHYYRREQHPVRVEDGTTVTAWIYLCEKASEYPLIPEGNWSGRV